MCTLRNVSTQCQCLHQSVCAINPLLCFLLASEILILDFFFIHRFLLQATTEMFVTEQAAKEVEVCSFSLLILTLYFFFMLSVEFLIDSITYRSIFRNILTKQSKNLALLTSPCCTHCRFISQRKKSNLLLYPLYDHQIFPVKLQNSLERGACILPLIP